MARHNYSYRDVRAVANKLDSVLVFRKNSKEGRANLVIEGVKMWPVTFPNHHGNRDSPSIGFIRDLIKDLGVDDAFFDGLASCPKELADYLREIEPLTTTRQPHS